MIQNIPGIRFWMRANNTAFITSSGGAVSAYADMSGLRNNATQGTAANQPTTGTRTIGGKNALDFDGVNDFFNLPNAVFNNLTSGSFTLVVVGQSDPTVAGQYFFGTSSGQRVYIQTQTSTNQFFARFGPGTELTLTANQNPTIPSITIATSEGSSDLCTFEVNGISAGSGTKAYSGGPASVNLGSFNAGGSGFLDGLISEVIIWERVLSASELTTVRTELSNFYGIAL